MNIKKFTGDLIAANCYLIWNDKEAAIIDPSAHPDKLEDFIKALNIPVKYLILTHVHLDHILFVDDLREKYNAKVIVHQVENSYLGDYTKNASDIFGTNMTFHDADILANDGDVIELGDERLEIIHTPGHTPGGICIKIGNDLFTGDTLFKESVGATHLGFGNQMLLGQSIKKLMMLEDSVNVYSGHGLPTTIGYERRNNPYIEIL